MNDARRTCRVCNGQLPCDHETESDIERIRAEQIDDTLTGNPDGVTAPEIPDPPRAPDWANSSWTMFTTAFVIQVWQLGWRAGYEAARLDQGRTQ